MNRFHLCIPSAGEALRYAVAPLAEAGVSFSEDPDQANVLLYPLPTPYPLAVEPQPGQLLVGGNLQPSGGVQLDLLKDPFYVAANAALTAEAALGIILQALPCRLSGCSVLILGWGRIGKLLSKKLQLLGAEVSIFARNPMDQALLHAMGFAAVSPEKLPQACAGCRCIVNTVPAAVLFGDAKFDPRCLKLDLASGVFLPGADVISARGLPGKCRPEASGELIARRVIAFLKGADFV